MNPEKENHTVRPAIEFVAEFFTKRCWSFEHCGDKGVIHTGFNGRWACVATVEGQKNHLLFLSVLPCKAAPGRRAACAELLSRINFHLTQGCFEMDFDDGEVRFRTTVPVVSTNEMPKLIEHVAFSNLCTVDRFVGALMSVVYAGVSSEAALKPKPATQCSACPELN